MLLSSSALRSHTCVTSNAVVAKRVPSVVLGVVNSTPKRSLNLSARSNGRLARVHTVSAHPMVARQTQRMFSTGPPTLVIPMPSLSPTMTQGNIASWRVKVGDEVKPGMVLADIETDKATMEFESQEEGFVAMILIEGGAQGVEVGKPILVLVDDASLISQVTAPNASSQQQQKQSPPAASAAPSTAPSAPSQASSSQQKYPPHLVVDMPSLSPTMLQGNLATWRVKVGDVVKPGTIIAEIETDKATMEFESQEEGFVAKLLISAGAKEVPVGKPILVLAEEKETIKEFESFSVAPKAEQQQAPQQNQAPQQKQAPQTPQQQAPQRKVQAAATSTGGRVIASPLAKKIARENGLDIATLSGAASGPDGRIIAQDVNAALKGGVPARAAPAAPQAAQQAPKQHSYPVLQSASGTFKEIPHSNIRRIVAQKLTEAKQSIPHFYVTVDCRMDAMVSLRERINKNFGDNVKVSINDLIIKACACALKEVPAANASFHQDFVRVYDYVDISVAMQTDAGLLVPVVRSVHNKGLHEISRDMKLLGEKGRAGKLMPQEMDGGTFTVSNLGMFGVKNFSAIINPPQACILAVGGTEPRAVVVGDKIEIQKTMTVTLSCDHRVVDGVLGAKLLAAFKKFVEDPTLMLL